MTEKIISGCSTSTGVALITLNNVPNKTGIISEIFNTIALENINIDMITQSPSYKGILTVSFTIPSSDLSKAISAAAKFRKDIPNLRLDIDSDNSKICVFGDAMRSLPGVAANIYSVLSRNEVDIKLVTTSETDISYLVSAKDEDNALEAIKREFNI